MKLNIGGPGARQDSREQPALINSDAERPGALEQPFQANAGLSRQGAQIIIGGDRLRHPEHQSELQMVLQILANARKFMDDVDTVTPQQITRSDA